MLTIAELCEAMRPINALYGPVVRQRNMVHALQQCGLPVPHDPGCGVANFNDVLAKAISAEIDRRKAYFSEEMTCTESHQSRT